MTTLDELRRRLAVLEPTRLDVVDDSAKHAGHAGAGQGAHLRVTIVSAKFAGLGTMARHRLVYDTVGDLMTNGAIHALSIAATPPPD